MREKKTRIDTTGAAEPLTSSPFADLLGGSAPTKETPKAPEPASTQAPARPFAVARTKKGGYPVSLERRAAGKSVTVLRNVSGDTDALLSLLKKRCAAGGKALSDSIEIQGDQVAKVEVILREQGL